MDLDVQNLFRLSPLKGRISGRAVSFHGQQGIKLYGFCLIPIGSGRYIIASVAIMSMLHGDLYAFIEYYRIKDMVPVQGNLTAPVGSPAQYYAVIRSADFLLGAPGSIEIIFSSGSMQEEAMLRHR